MKKYLLLTLVCLSSSVFANEMSARLGQVENSFGQNDCNAPEVKGCGPCYKACIQQNKSERDQRKDIQSGKKGPSNSGQSASDA